MAHTVGDLIQALKRASLFGGPPGPPNDVLSARISGLTADSRAVTPGMAYIAVRGSQVDGHKFIADAVKRGAVAVVVEKASNAGVPELIVEDGRRAAIALARFWYDDPGSKLRLVGITGTNGKTTTTALVRHLLNGRGTAGSIGTLGAFDGNNEPVESTAGSLTTPGPIDLQATLAALVSRGVTDVAMETSSHSLDQGRLDGLMFSAGVFTNLTRDHLDYHGTMDSYRDAKLKLNTLLTPNGAQVVNADDPAWAALPLSSHRLTFGLSGDAMVRATDLQLGNAGSTFELDTPHGRAVITLPLLGEFNVANALGAAATALALGHPFKEVVERLLQAPQVPGRMERIISEPTVVLRDYAHTPDALERALQALRPVTPGKLIVVFGCGGDRDRGKRPVMGRLAAELADLAIVTSDNPRTEDPDAIIDEVEQGMGSKPHERFADRRDAIARAVKVAGARDTVLLAGKGHETYQVLGTEKVPFDEAEIVHQVLGR